MDNTPEEIWESCLTFIKNNIGEQPFNTWFKPIGFYSFVNNKLYLSVPNEFFVEYIESHFLDILRVTILKFYGKISLGYHIQIGEEGINEGSTTASQAVKSTKISSSIPVAPEVPELDSNLNPGYTFENFVQGDCNKLPSAIAHSISEKYQNTFNPYFIYGASGVGKSHLVNAIGTKVLELHPQKRVIYVSAHLFMIQFTESRKNNTFNDFMNFYQSIDVLIIDDIQEIAGKEKTQEAFFNIFNHLHRNQKQLILTCDRPPVSLEGMEERLLSRFKWGMIAELEEPDYNLRKSILEFKTQQQGLDISEEVINYIAENVNGSVRNLEGIINSIIAHSIVINSEINIELAEKVISKVVSTHKKSVTIDTILETVCKKYSLKTHNLVSSSRKKEIVHARQITMYLSQKLTNMSSTQIGSRLKRDHATVLHSCTLIENRLSTDKAFQEELRQLENTLSR